VIRAVKHDSIAEVSLTQPARADVDAYLLQRQALEPQLAPHSPLFVSNSNRSKGQRLTYWGVQEVMKLLTRSTGIELHAHRGRHTFCPSLSSKSEMDTAGARSRP
jgi:integrase/recombinase XerD